MSALNRTLLITALVGAAGCQRTEIIATQIELQLPTQDPGAPALTRFTLEVWPQSAQACSKVLSWWVSRCNPNEPCAAFDREAVIEGAPVRTATVTTGGAPISLDLASDAPTELLVMGFSTTEEVVALACDDLILGSGARFRLERPWCRRRDTCAEQYHPGCALRVSCPALGIEGEPQCEPVDSIQLWWGVTESCEPQDGNLVWPGACAQSTVNCAQETPSGFGVVMDEGVCPQSEDSACDLDTNCDGLVTPCDLDAICAMDPASTATAACTTGVDGVCEGIAMCSRGRSGLCEPLVREDEICDGVDNDCDNVPDEQDGNAQVYCLQNAGPGASQCRLQGDRVTCGCGDRLGCGAGEACCAGTCVPRERVNFACGCANNPCGGDTVCQSGRCVPLQAPTQDAGVADSGVRDDLGAPQDLGVDAGMMRPDAGRTDLGPSDLGPPDLGPSDTGPEDLGADMGEETDAGDFGPRDTGPADMRRRDQG